jgi:hypothetical protein
MQPITGKISLIKMLAEGDRAAQVNCSPAAFPRPGQYLHAYSTDAPDAVLGASLFPVGWAAPLDAPVNAPRLLLAPIPATWGPGTSLVLRGPLGHGFNIPASVNRLGLIALGHTAERLLPLIQPALAENADIAIFCDIPLPPLPALIEIRPLSALPDALTWADFLAFDLPLEMLPDLRERLRLSPYESLPCPAQALMDVPMPCAGVGNCGICAIPARGRGYRLACKAGPVFDLSQLAW